MAEKPGLGHISNKKPGSVFNDSTFRTSLQSGSRLLVSASKKEKTMIYLVTRHAGAIEWLRAKGYDGVAEPHLEKHQITGGNLYIGVLPIPMVKEILDAGSRFFLLVLPDIASAQRGQEMTPEETDRAGAGLVEVTSIDLAPVDFSGGHKERG